MDLQGEDQTWILIPELLPVNTRMVHGEGCVSRQWPVNPGNLAKRTPRYTCAAGFCWVFQHTQVLFIKITIWLRSCPERRLKATQTMPCPVFPVPSNPIGQRLAFPNLCSEALTHRVPIGTSVCGVFTIGQTLCPLLGREWWWKAGSASAS